MWRKVRRFLAGEDGPTRRAWPLGEFLHPAPLAALAVLAVNDHVLKGAGVVPGWLTGKLSDFAGALFFPLLVTAIVDCLLYAAGRRRAVDFTLRRWKLAAACALTAGVMVAIELSQAAADRYAGAMRELGFRSSVSTADPTDLVALVMLAGAWWIGRGEIARVPLGRIELIERRRDRAGRAGRGGGTGRAGRAFRAADALADVRALRRRDAAVVDELAAALDAGDAARAEAVLARLRGDQPVPPPSAPPTR